jgi:hypothetical protein
MASPLWQTSWQAPGLPPPAPGPAPPAPAAPPPTPPLPPVGSLGSHTPAGEQVLPAGQATEGEHSAQRWELQALVAQALVSASVQVTQAPEAVSQT